MDSSADPLFDVHEIAKQIGEDGLDALWQEVREQWLLDMEVMISEQMLISGHARRHPGKINRVLDCYPDMFTHPLFDNYVQVAYGWEANWRKDPDKVKWVKRKFEAVNAPCEKPMDRGGWVPAFEKPTAGSGRIALTDRMGNIL